MVEYSLFWMVRQWQAIDYYLLKDFCAKPQESPRFVRIARIASYVNKNLLINYSHKSVQKIQNSTRYTGIVLL